MSGFLIEHRGDGHLEYVLSLEGYPEDEWAVVGEGEGCCPVDHAHWNGAERRWEVDAEAKAKAEEAARLRAMPRDDFMAEVERRLGEREAKMKADHAAEIAALRAEIRGRPSDTGGLR